MAINRSLLIIVLSMTFAFNAVASTISLKAAISLALAQNRNLARSETLLDESRADVDAISDAFDTHIQPILSVQNIDGHRIKNYGFSATKKFMAGTQVTISASRGDMLLPNGAITVQPAESISITQPLFRNAGTMVNEAAEYTAESAVLTARRQFAHLREKVVIEVVAQYTELFRLQQQIKVDKVALLNARELVRLTAAYELVGRSKRLDTMRAQFDVDRDREKLNADKQRLVEERASFVELLGLQPGAVLSTKPVVWANYKEINITDAMHTALQNRLDYAQALQDLSDSNRQVMVAKNNALPVVNLTVGYQRYDQSSFLNSTVPSGGGVFASLSGGASDDQAQARALVRKTETGYTAAMQNITIVEMNIAREVQQAVTAYQEARTENAISERSAKRSQARLRLARELFHLGRADSFDVSDAQKAYMETQAALLNANQAVVRAAYNLSYTLGTLLSEPVDLKPIPSER